MASSPAAGDRQIRSFVKREGRLTTGQARALEALWPRYGIAPGDVPLDWAAGFARSGPVVLEIGFGDGEALASMAAARPHENFLGIEVHRPGIGHLLRLIDAQGLDNIRLLEGDAAVLLRTRFRPASLDRVLLFFPDPWPKKRHHKRRILQSGFADLLGQRLKPGGLAHLATDWQPYAEHVQGIMEANPHFHAVTGHQSDAIIRLRPLTKFEVRGNRLGHAVHDLVFKRC